MADAIEAMRDAFLDLHAGNAVLQERVATSNAVGTHLSMPCSLGDYISLKSVTVFPGNAVKELPTTQGALLLHSGKSGEALALMDAELLTQVRTGAASALASSLLARQPVKRVGLVGAGAIGEFQMRAMRVAFPEAECLICDKDEDRARSVAASLGEGCQSAKIKDVLDCEVICLATSSTKPVLLGSKIKPGTHVNGVGSFRPDMAEVDLGFLQKANVYVDHLPAAQKSAGEMIQAVEAGGFSWSDVRGSIGELLAGAVAGRQDEGEVTFFKSVGVGVQDTAVAQIVYERARERGLGQRFELD